MRGIGRSCCRRGAARGLRSPAEEEAGDDRVFCGARRVGRDDPICVVTPDGAVALEIEASTDPAAISAALTEFTGRRDRGAIALVAAGLKALGLLAVCLGIRHARAGCRRSATRPIATTGWIWRICAETQ